MAEAVGVGELIDPPALPLHGAELGQHPLVGDGGEEALPHLPLSPAPPAALPGEDALGPLGHLRLQLRGLEEGRPVGRELGRRPQAAVGPGVAVLVALHGPLQLPSDLLEAGVVVAGPQIHVPLHRPRQPGLHHMGGRAVHDGGAAVGQEDGVQGVRVPGAADVLHPEALFLRPGGHLAHEGGLAAAGPALQDQQLLRLPRVQELVIEGIEAAGGVGSQVISDLWFRCHGLTSQYRF